MTRGGRLALGVVQLVTGLLIAAAGIGIAALLILHAS